MRRTLFPVFAVVVAVFAIWYVACMPMNIREVLTAVEREGAAVDPPAATARQEVGRIALVLRNLDHIGPSWSVERARLPSPHQIVQELWDATVVEELFSRRGIVQSGSLSNRSLIHHGIVTLSATVAGFVIGAGLGMVLAIGIVHNRAMDMSVMPWAIVSQTIPIVALAPMMIVVLSSIGMQGLLPKAVISAYLSFFPVVVGMVKGLRAPDAMQLDQMRTWSAGASAVL